MGTSDRRPYLLASTVTQSLLDECQDNLTNKLELIAEVYNVGDLGETLYLSNRNKYVGQHFYQSRIQFPNIQRTLGDWLSNELEFSSLELLVNNADGFFNYLLPGGGNYNGWIGKEVKIKIGIDVIESSYITVFSGEVTEVGGFRRNTKSFTLICRSNFERVNALIPNSTFIREEWPYIEKEFEGQFIPIIYGDWTTSLRPEGAEVPVFVVNGLDPKVNASLDPPDPDVGSVEVYGVISSTTLKEVDLTSCIMLRGEIFHHIPEDAIRVVIGSGNRFILITQKSFIIKENEEDPGELWVYESGDQFFIKCKGVDLSGYDDNIVAQGKDMLKRFGGLVDSDFHANWETYKVKATPAENAIVNIKSRAWIQEERKALEYVLSMFEQVRLEVFVDINNKFKISSLHFDDFVAAPIKTLRNWDIARGTFQPSLDDRNQFNRAKADYSYSPVKKENAYSSAIWKNQANREQIGRFISKLITFPNLYILEDVNNQLKEILKLAAHIENVEVTVTTRAFLWELGEDIAFNVNIGGVVFENNDEPVTGKIRSLNFDPNGSSLILKIWCFQMVPFPGSEKTSISGITGGSTATITQET